jgi:hypothetical protein
MSEAEIKLKCIELAKMSGVHASDVLSTAKEMYKWVAGKRRGL